MAEIKPLSFLREFRDFAMKGNVLDMAIGVVIGAAFGKIVSSLVADIITPLMGLLCGGVDFKHLGITLVEKTADKDAVVLTYGVFLQTIFDFVIIAFAIFLSIKRKRLKRLRRKLQNLQRTLNFLLKSEIFSSSRTAANNQQAHH